LLDGRKLITLRDAALYITKLPKAGHDAEERQAAMEALLVRSRPLEEAAAFLTRNQVVLTRLIPMSGA
jgi:hypothetical protein